MSEDQETKITVLQGGRAAEAIEQQKLWDAIAQATMIKYQAMRKAGFTDEQAIHLVSILLEREEFNQ
jgi:hypothetical protein